MLDAAQAAAVEKANKEATDLTKRLEDETKARTALEKRLAQIEDERELSQYVAKAADFKHLPLTAAELAFGLDRLMELCADRAPVLLPNLLEQVNKVRATLGLLPRGDAKSALPGGAAARTGAAKAGGKFRSTARVVDAGQAGGSFKKSKTRAGTLFTDAATLSKEAKQEQQEALARLETLCLQVLDLSFAAVALDKKVLPYLAQCPFPGMRAFGPEEQRYFFGRDALIESLLRRLKEHPFLAVLGASGSGDITAVSTIDGHYGFIGYANTTFDTGSGTVVVTLSSHPGAQMVVTT